MLIALVAYQASQVRRRQLAPLPYPINRRTGEPQTPNGAVLDARDTTARRIPSHRAP